MKTFGDIAPMGGGNLLGRAVLLSGRAESRVAPARKKKRTANRILANKDANYVVCNKNNE
jgi:hypothetical protein